MNLRWNFEAVKIVTFGDLDRFVKLNRCNILAL
jgi:hypothetical protein